jgi:hypothetical protein
VIWPLRGQLERRRNFTRTPPCRPPLFLRASQNRTLRSVLREARYASMCAAPATK